MIGGQGDGDEKREVQDMDSRVGAPELGSEGRAH